MRRVPILIAVTLACSLAGGAPGSATADGAAASSWPGLRGPGYDGAVRNAKLVMPGATAALKVSWKVPLGPGYSMPTAGDGKIVALFSSGDGDYAAAFKADSGAELWRYRIDDIYKGHDGSHDGPVSSPLLIGGRVYGFSPRGILFALDAATGKAVWSKDLVKEGATAPFYGFTTSPILVGKALIVQMGAGKGKSIGGFNPQDGQLLWSVGDDTVNYQSPIAATVGGTLQVIAPGDTTVVGLDPATGKELWSYAHKGDQSASGGGGIVPVPVGEGRFHLKLKDDASTMIQVAREGGGWKVSELWTKNSIRGNYVIPVYHDGYLYGMSGLILTCADAATGETKWKSREAGDGFLTLVGNHLVIIGKAGTLTLAEASPEGYRQVARTDLFAEHAWSAVAYADGHLYARSMAHLARIDVTAGAAEQPVTTAGSWVDGTAFGRFLADVRKAPDKAAMIDKYLAQQKTLPVIEDTGAVHFVYRGPATDVALSGDLMGSEREDPLSRVEGTDLFYYSTLLEPDAAITYAYIVDYAKPIADPRNPRTTPGERGDVSWLAMPAWREPSFTGQSEKAKPGRLEPLEFTRRAAGPEGKEKKRTAQVYLPADYDAQKERRYPTLYVPDGTDALEKGGMKETLDQLIGTRLEPVIAVFIMPDPEAPWELWNADPYAQMVIKDLVPTIDAKYRTIAQASQRAVAGAGSAANVSLVCALKNPDTFLRLGSQSAFVLDGSHYDAELQGPEKRPMVIYLRWGAYDARSTREAWDITKGNRSLWALMRQRGYKPAGGESNEGSGWGIWRGHTEAMLAALFPLTP